MTDPPCPRERVGVGGVFVVVVYARGRKAAVEPVDLDVQITRRDRR